MSTSASPPLLPNIAVHRRLLIELVPSSSSLPLLFHQQLLRLDQLDLLAASPLQRRPPPRRLSSPTSLLIAASSLSSAPPPHRRLSFSTSSSSSSINLIASPHLTLNPNHILQDAELQSVRTELRTVTSQLREERQLREEIKRQQEEDRRLLLELSQRLGLQLAPSSHSQPSDQHHPSL